MLTLSVVLISRNQAWNIERLITSVLLATTDLPDVEIVLVDSASTDGTPEIGTRYPIDVLRLRADQPLTLAAGRYIGYQQSTGDLVLFLDGDMELCSGWLEQALRLMAQRPEVGLVTGQVVDLPRMAGPHDKPALVLSERVSVLEYCGGAALYRRAVLRQVGTFNPYIRSDEEPELCIRIRHAGYQILRIECPIVFHYSDPGEALATIVGRWQRGLYLGAGHNIRYLLGQPTFWWYIRERGYGCGPLAGLLLGAISMALSYRTRRWRLFAAWAALPMLLLAGLSYRRRSFKSASISFVKRLLIVDGLIRGFLIRPLAPDTYPGHLDVIKRKA